MRFMLAMVIVFLSGCAEFSKMKVGKDGVYRFKTHPITVQAPDRCLLDMFVYDSDRSVDFVTGRGYWMEGGQYAVQVFETPKDIKDRASFLNTTKAFFKEYMVKDRAPLGLNLTIKEEKEVEVGGRLAYQAISVDEGKAGFIATSILHTSRITTASLVYPVKPGTDATKEVPWKCYNAFVESIKEVR